MFNKSKFVIRSKKFGKLFIFFGFSSLAFLMHGCLLDELDTLTQEIPFSYDVDINSSAASAEQSTTIRLNDNSFYRDNQSKINSIEFVKISYKTKSVNPNNLDATVNFALKQANGTVLLSQDISGKPADFLVNPYELKITQAQIQLINAYLANFANQTLIATVSVTTSTTGNKIVQGQVFTVFKMNYTL